MPKRNIRALARARHEAKRLAGTLNGRYTRRLVERSATVTGRNLVTIYGQKVDAQGVSGYGGRVNVVNIGRPAAALYAPAQRTQVIATGGGAGAAGGGGTVTFNWPWFNVLDYSVVGNGSDEYAVIKAVLDQACAVNGTIIFPGNGRVYGLGQGLPITGPVTVWIMQGATLKFVAQPDITHSNTIGDFTSAFASILYGNNVNAWQVQNDGIIDGNSWHRRFNPTGFTGTTGIVVQGGQNVLIDLGRVQRVNAGVFLINTRLVTVQNGRGRGYLVPAIVSAEGIDNCVISNLRAENTHELLDFNADCDYNTVTNCVAANVVDEALDINRSSHNLFRNIYIYGDPESMPSFRPEGWAVGVLYNGVNDEIGDIVLHNGSYWRHLGTPEAYAEGVLSTAADEPGTPTGTIWARFGCDGILLQASAGVRFSTKSGTGSDFNVFDGIDGYITRNAADAFITLQAGYVYSEETGTEGEFSCANNTLRSVHCLGAGRGIFVNLGADIEADEDYRGEWAVGVLYEGKPYGGGDLVKQGTLYYRCLADHTSTATDAPGTAGGSSLWGGVEGSGLLEIDAGAGLEILDCYFEDITREAIHFQGVEGSEASGLTIDDIYVIGSTTQPRIYLENVRQVSISGIKLPAIAHAAVGLQLFNASDVNISDFYIAAGEAPVTSANYGIGVGGQSERVLIHSGILRNFAGPPTRGAIALVSGADNDLTAIRIQNVIFEGNTWAVWDDTLAKGGNSFINDCTLISNTNAIRTPSRYSIYGLSHDNNTYPVTRGGAETLTNKTYVDPIVTGHVTHTAAGAFDAHSIVRDLADVYDVLSLRQDNAGASGAVLELWQDGSGRLMRGYRAGSEVFYVDNTGRVVAITTGSAASFTRHEVNPAQTLRSMFGFKAQRDNAMADGYGPRAGFYAQDDEGIEQALATIGAVRSGADNSGAFVIETANGGTLSERLRVGPTGDLLISGNAIVTDSLHLVTDEVAARDAGGLRLEDDGNNIGVFIEDGGEVGMGTTTPEAKLHVRDATLAGLLERTLSNTTNLRAVARLRVVSSGSAADGFGPGLTFEMHDAEMTAVNIIGSMGFVRSGADNTSKWEVQAANAGTLVKILEVSTAGLLQPVGGISFGNETLNMYDEGTWTPTITGSTSNPTVTYTEQLGRYTQIGNLLFFSLRITIATYSGGAGTLRISLPTVVPAGNVNSTNATLRASGVDFTTPISLSFGPIAGQSYAQIQSMQDNAAVVTEAVGILAAGDVLVASGFYFAN